MECASLPSSFLPSFLISSIRTPGTITTLLPSGRFPPLRGKIRRCRSLGPRDLLRREKEFGKKRHHPYFFYSTSSWYPQSPPWAINAYETWNISVSSDSIPRSSLETSSIGDRKTLAGHELEGLARFTASLRRRYEGEVKDSESLNEVNTGRAINRADLWISRDP